MADMASDHRDQGPPAEWWSQSLRVGRTLSPGRKGPWQSRSVVSLPTGTVVPGLFALQQTGISTKPVQDAADAFIASLTEEQRNVTLHPIDSVEWRRWSNWEQYPFRHGLSMEEMRPSQLRAALELLRASLSVRGYTTARTS